MHKWHGCTAQAEGSRTKGWSGRSVETLEDRKLLSSGMGSLGGVLSGVGEGFGSRGTRIIESPCSREDVKTDSSEEGRSDCGGGMNQPSLLLTAPLLEGGTGQSAPPSPGVLSECGSSVGDANAANGLEDGRPERGPADARVGWALQDDLDAIRQGTLTGTAATTKIQADQAAILTSMGLTAAQVSQIQSDQQAFQTAITSAGTSTSTSTSGTVSTSAMTGTSGPSAAVQTAMQTLQTALQTDMPTQATLSHEASARVQDDLDAIRKGTLTETAAVTQVQTDAAAVFTSMGLTSAQVTQIQADQQALATAIAVDPNQPTVTSSSDSANLSTLQSVSAYLVDCPGFRASGWGVLRSATQMAEGWEPWDSEAELEAGRAVD